MSADHRDRAAADEPTGDPSPRSLETHRPVPTRMYDYFLGGAHNFQVDRDAADDVLAVLPETRSLIQESRAFLRRAVRFLVEDAGVTQFLDLGSGIPAAGTVHEIAQAANPDCRVVYVDDDPIAVGRSRKVLADNANAEIVAADLRDPGLVLAHPATRRLLDFSRPVAVLIVAVLPFIPDTDHPRRIVAAYRDACAPGSYLALSHALTAEFWPSAVGAAVELYAKSTDPLHLRRPPEVTAFFDGYRLLDPGLVPAAAWRPDQPVPDTDATESRSIVGIGVR